jgi:ATP-binding cassette subfamily F protein 3
MLAAENLSKSFGAQMLFDNISFKINPKERVGLVGRNGHGKTTMFRILVGEEDYDGGTLSVPKNYRIGYVQQQLDFKEDTILKEGMRGLPPAEKDHHWKVEKILVGLGFSNEHLHRPPGEFSGGFQVRLNLAKVLVSEPDLLLLDEPTNYLDITSIRWIERFLLSWPHELMLITHDRSFMDRLVTHTLGIHRRKIRKIAGNTEKYYTQIAQDEEIYEKTRQNDERRAREIEQFITRFRAKARLAGLVQSRVKTLAKLEKHNKLEQLRDLEFSFRSQPFRGKQLLSVRELAFAYRGQQSLFKEFDFSLNTGDRVCVVGPNGKGKTTLLKLLAGKLSALTGEIVYHPGVIRGFYEQTNVQTLHDKRTVEEEIQSSHPDVDRQQARNICGAMLFEGDSALKRIEMLSGGEKARVMLGKLLATPVNLLLLDEPTNHLDMESCDALLEAIDNFDGAVVMVTHNEMFLHALAQRLIVFARDGVDVFEGTYQDFLEKGGWGDESECSQLKISESSPEPHETERVNKKELRRQRSVVISERSRLLKPIEKAVADSESVIETEEKRLANMNQAMVEASAAQDGGRIAELSQQIHRCRNEIDEQFNQLEALYEQKENLEAEFDRRLADLEDAQT